MLMHDSSYTSYNWQYISAGCNFLVLKKRITVRILHLTVTARTSPILDNCQAETERHSEAIVGRIQSGGEPAHAAVLPDFA